MSPTLATAVIDSLFLVVHGVLDPSEREWAAYLELVKRQGVEGTQALIHSDGGGPTASQRQALVRLVAGREVRTAIVSGSTRVRGHVMALSWFNSRVKAFQPSQLHEALIFLEIPRLRRDYVERELNALRAQVRPATPSPNGGPA